MMHKKALVALFFGTLIITATTFFYKAVSAASSPWTQTDWSGGITSGTVDTTVNTYSASSNVITSTSGQITLAPTSERAILKGNQVEGGTTNFNTSTKNALTFNSSQDYNDSAFTYDGGDPTKLTVDKSGDYLISLTMPFVNSITNSSVRYAVESEVRVNGTKYDGAITRSSYTRAADNHNEASNHVSILLNDLSAGDYIQVYVGGYATISGTYTGSYTMYAERITDDKTAFSATATRTISGTNLNTTESALQWTEGRKDSGFTHSNSSNSHQITIDNSGYYLVTVNVPMSSTVQRANLLGQVKLDSTLVDGGIFQNGYSRGLDGHTRSSIHWDGIVQATADNQVLSITLQMEAASGTVTVGSDVASIYIQKLPSSKIYWAEATTVGGGSNWYPSSKTTIDWSTDNVIDTSVYSHSESTNNDEIIVLEDGDYLLAYNHAVTGAVQRANPKVTVQVNGGDITGAESKTGYIRDGSNHNSSSDPLLIPLSGLSAGDVITVSTEPEARPSGTLNDDTPATIMLWQKGYEDTGSVTSNIFDPGFPADWGTLTYNYSGSGNVVVKMRTDSNADMSGATAWSSCTSISSGADVSSNSCVNDADRYIQYQVTLTTGTGQSPTFEDISIEYVASDSVPPTTNASNIQIIGYDSGNWLKTAPTISWDAGADDVGGIGLIGYCIALDETTEGGSSSSLDPATSSGKLTGLNDGVALSSCPYIVTGTSVNFNTISGLNLTSDKDYYFSIKAIDAVGNIWTGSSGDFQDLTYFKYDGTAPTNVTFISTPSSSFGSVNDMFFTWPSSGGTSSDSESGVLGWQYAINNTSDWRGGTSSNYLGITYIPLSGATYIQYLDESFDTEITEGNNTIYFRTVDNAGNTSTYTTGGLAYGGAAPTFSQGSEVTVTATTQTTNSYTSNINNFSLSWPDASISEGSLNYYYYMVNTTPPTSRTTLEGNSTLYKPVSTTSVSAQKLTGSVRGTNTVYVVATDTEDNYSPTNVISGTYVLNSTNPDPPQNLIGSDASLKANELWRATLTWETPAYIGTGELTYVVQRSSDNSTWTDVGTTQSLSYTDSVDTSDIYYYRVGSYDTSSQSIADPSYTSSVSVDTKGTFDEPPELTSEPEVTSITTKRATITWSTDRIGDTRIQYGTGSEDYFDEEPSKSDLVTAHSIELTNLSPGTRYYYTAKWTDEDGNTGISDEGNFSTDPAPIISDVEVATLGINSVVLKFTSKDAAKVKIYYGESTSFGGLSEISTSSEEATYAVTLTGLKDGTKYFYKINTLDVEDDEYDGTVLDFTTLPRPQVSNVRIQQVRGTAQPTVLISWTTNTPVSSIVTLYPENNPADTRDEINVELKEGEHKMIIRGLLPQTKYVLTVSGRDIVGNEASAEPNYITTETDTRPPLISNLKVEGNSVASADGETQTAQLVISWDTDEAASSQVEYGEGTGSVYAQKTQEDNNLTYNHLVLISGLTPSKVYHLRAISKDSNGNATESIDTVTITPKATENALDLVISNLQEAFKFLGGIR